MRVCQSTPTAAIARASGDSAAGAAACAGSGAVMRMRRVATCAMSISSRSCSSTAAARRCPDTNVPLAEPRSSICTRPSVNDSRACARDTAASSMLIAHCAPRPMTSAAAGCTGNVAPFPAPSIQSAVTDARGSSFGRFRSREARKTTSNSGPSVMTSRCLSVAFVTRRPFTHVPNRLPASSTT